MNEQKQTARLSNWSIITHRYYTAPFASLEIKKEEPKFLHGIVLHHFSPWLLDGERIYTSEIVEIKPELGQIETLNTIYFLDEMDGEYGKWLVEKAKEEKQK